MHAQPKVHHPTSLQRNFQRAVFGGISFYLKTTTPRALPAETRRPKDVQDFPWSS